MFGVIVAAEDNPTSKSPIGRYRFHADAPVEVLSLRELDAFATARMSTSGAYVAGYFATRDPLEPSFARALVHD